MFSIHVDDSQLNVYSSRIADAVLRAATEIESISKELYKRYGGTKNGEYKFDSVALKYLQELWSLDKKKVIISSPLCFQTNRVLLPLAKNEVRTSSTTGRQTFSWNNAYQNLKHNRGSGMRFGSLKYLFDIMAALYVLNIYYKDETIDLGKDSAGVNFSTNLGSQIFSITAVNCTGRRGSEHIKPPEFESAVYYIDSTIETDRVFQESMDAFNAQLRNLLIKHPNLVEYLKDNDISNYHGNNLAWDVLGKDGYTQLLQEAGRVSPLKTDQLRYRAVVNKQDI